MAIQGEGHASPFVGQPVITGGIVTAVDSNGFYLQDPTGDGNARTSDGIFIKTAGTSPTVKVGDAVELTGVVGEYKPSDTGLSVTQVTAGRHHPVERQCPAGGGADRRRRPAAPDRKHRQRRPDRSSTPKRRHRLLGIAGRHARHHRQPDRGRQQQRIWRDRHRRVGRRRRDRDQRSRRDHHQRGRL
jgi:hypothetical protein